MKIESDPNSGPPAQPPQRPALPPSPQPAVPSSEFPLPLSRFPAVRCLALTLAICACAQSDSAPSDSSPMKQVSESYVKLALAVGKHDGDYVDAYYGPAEWKAEA